jgi:flagellum-specific ATP synthase
MEVNVQLNKGFFKRYSNLIDEHDFIRCKGRINKVIGLVYESIGPQVRMGEKCIIKSSAGDVEGYAEVVGFRGNKVLLMPLSNLKGIAPGSEVLTTGEPFFIKISDDIIGRVVDGLGEPIDEKGPIRNGVKYPIDNTPPKALDRKRISEYIVTGIRSIDTLHTFGKGQKVGIFSGSGVGKSILLGMIARNTKADLTVIGLVGERGREVREFIEKDLGEEGLKSAVVVVETNDKPALLRIKGAMTATTIAEYFRDKGMDVMLLMDSASRIAIAQREIGLSIGEPPTTRGYPPSMYAFLPKLMERVGATKKGSITGIYTVLVEGDDLSEPVSDITRSILDGHIVLSRRLSNANHYPAVDVLNSISRLMIDVVSEEHRVASYKLKNLLATYRESEDLINIGAYSKGSNPKIDEAINLIDSINQFLRQDIYEKCEFDESLKRLLDLVKNISVN